MKKTLLIQETHVDRDADAIVGECDPYAPWTDNIGRLFKSLQREYGRCVSKAYIDPDARHIGWVFIKRQRYERSSKTYIAETWITTYYKEDGKFRYLYLDA